MAEHVSNAWPWWLEPLRSVGYRVELLPDEVRRRVLQAARVMGIALGPGRQWLADGRER